MDCKYFDHFDEEEPFYPPDERKPDQKYKKKNLDMNFIGYTCNKEVELQRAILKETLINCFEEYKKEEEPGPGGSGQGSKGNRNMEMSGFSTGGMPGDTSMITNKEQNYIHAQNMEKLTKQVFSH